MTEETAKQLLEAIQRLTIAVERLTIGIPIHHYSHPPSPIHGPTWGQPQFAPTPTVYPPWVVTSNGSTGHTA